MENSQNPTLMFRCSPIPGSEQKSSKGFPHMLIYNSCVENYQNYILTHSCLPITGRLFYNVRKLHWPRIWEFNLRNTRWAWVRISNHFISVTYATTPWRLDLYCVTTKKSSQKWLQLMEVTHWGNYVNVLAALAKPFCANLNTLEDGGLFIRCNIYMQEFSKEGGGGKNKYFTFWETLCSRGYYSNNINFVIN